jgi:hypothetical protein
MPPRKNARGRPPRPGDRPENAHPSAPSEIPTVARSTIRTTATTTGSTARRDPRALTMLEDRGSCSLDAHVRKLLKDLALWGYHVRNSKGSEPGWPDWVIIGPCRIIFRELKSETGTLTPEQREVGQMLQRAGQSWAVWRPSDLLSGQIARELTDLAAIQEALFTYGKPA